MRTYVVNRPDLEAMRRILEQTGPEGIVLRLAWQAGLTREEISALTWEQVSFLDNRLELPDRMIPLEADLRAALWRLYENHHALSPRVALSSRGKRLLAPESISRLARLALDREGQTQVRLMDLRHDWILRQLESKSWAETAACLFEICIDRTGENTYHRPNKRFGNILTGGTYGGKEKFCAVSGIWGILCRTH